MWPQFRSPAHTLEALPWPGAMDWELPVPSTIPTLRAMGFCAMEVPLEATMVGRLRGTRISQKRKEYWSRRMEGSRPVSCTGPLKKIAATAPAPRSQEGRSAHSPLAEPATGKGFYVFIVKDKEEYFFYYGKGIVSSLAFHMTPQTVYCHM